MEILTTATGKEFSCGYLVAAPHSGTAYIRIHDSNLVTLVTVFSDKNETAELTHGDTVFKGYTKFESILDEGNCIRISLRKE